MKQNRNKPKETSDAVVASDGYDLAEALVVSNMDYEKEWIMDSGCSFHMTPNKAWFEDYIEGDGGLVLLVNNKTCKIVGIGIIRMRMFNGIEKLLQDVRYVSKPKRNLISLGMLDI